MQTMADAMNSTLGAPLTVFLLSMIPIAEARFAIPFGMSMGLSPAAAFGWAFLGSSLIAPILLLVFIPVIKALSRTKVFSKLGKFLYDKFEKKSRSLESDDGTGAPAAETPTDAANAVSSDSAQKKKKPLLTKRDLKRMGGTALFVAVPLPLTGVWTGSAVASIVKIGFVKGLIGVITGNAVACGIITLISFLFKPYVNYITLAFLAIAIIVVLVLIIKLIIYKPDRSDSATPGAADSKKED